MKNPILLSACLLGLATFVSDASAADIEQGKAKAAVCVACHGVKGISPNPQWPNLAGQQDQYLILALKAYRDGGRNNPIMSPLAKNLSDADIENLAAYYASL